MSSCALIYLVSFVIAGLADCFFPRKFFEELLSLFKYIRLAILTHSIQEEQKEKVLVSYSIHLFRHSVKAAFLTFLFFFFPWILILFANEYLSNDPKDLFQLLVSINGVLLSSLTFLTYFLFKFIYARLRLFFRS
jgi:hypothetical protein